MNDPSTRTQLRTYLIEQGFKEQELDRIMKRLDEYDREMLHDSVFESIAEGTLNLKAIIKEALEIADSTDESPADDDA